VLCLAALRELCGHTIPKAAWHSKDFRSAFGLPSAETDMQLAVALQRLHPTWFDNALKNALRQGICGDSFRTVAQAIGQKRTELFDYYQSKLSLTEPTLAGRPLKLQIPSSTKPVCRNEMERLELLRPVSVDTYPFVKETIALLHSMGVRQGVCTSSPHGFVTPLLKKLQLMESFQGLVFSDCVPHGAHKPNPYPWRLLKARLSGLTSQHAERISTDDMIHFENSPSGGLSALRAGKGVTFIKADNEASVVGKLQLKLLELQRLPTKETVPGRAVFVSCFGRLHDLDEAKE